MMGRLPHTPSAKRVLEISIEEALDLKHDHCGTEHLLLGLVKAEGGVAAEVLRQLGATPERVREEVLRLASPQPTSPAVKEQLPPLPAEFDPLDAVIAELVSARDAAVADREFDRAAWLRDQAAALRQVREAILRQLGSGEPQPPAGG